MPYLRKAAARTRTAVSRRLRHLSSKAASPSSNRLLRRLAHQRKAARPGIRARREAIIPLDIAVLRRRRRPRIPYRQRSEEGRLRVREPSVRLVVSPSSSLRFAMWRAARARAAAAAPDTLRRLHRRSSRRGGAGR